MEKSNRAFDSKHKIPQISKRVIEKAEVWLKTHYNLMQPIANSKEYYEVPKWDPVLKTIKT